MADERRAKIAQLNDQLRRAEDENVPGQMVMTSGLNAHVIETGKSLLDVIELVSTYDDFGEDTDPYGERDFGAFVFEGEKCFWKIEIGCSNFFVCDF